MNDPYGNDFTTKIVFNFSINQIIAYLVLKLSKSKYTLICQCLLILLKVHFYMHVKAKKITHIISSKLEMRPVMSGVQSI